MAKTLKHRAPGAWSAGELTALRLAGTFAVCGVLALVLPLFGLQLRKLQKLGDNAPVAGGVFLGLAALVAGVVLLRRTLRGGEAARLARGLLLKVVLPVAGGLALLVVLLVAFAAFRGGRLRPVPPAPPGPVVGPPGVPPAGPGWKGPPPPPNLGDPAARYGADRTVRVVLVGADGLDLMPKLNAKARSLVDPGGGHALRRTTEAGVPTLTLAPVADLDAFARRIDFGTVTDIDKDRRVVTVAVDRAQFPEPNR